MNTCSEIGNPKKKTSLTSYFNSSFFCSRRLCWEAQQADWAGEPPKQEAVHQQIPWLTYYQLNISRGWTDCWMNGFTRIVFLAHAPQIWYWEKQMLVLTSLKLKSVPHVILYYLFAPEAHLWEIDLYVIRTCINSFLVSPCMFVF